MSEGFGKDLEFLKKHTDVIVLADSTNDVQVAVVPAWQGRVMTSTSGGKNGPSFGWINYELIESGELLPHINVFGGEDRFWMGPEGGQYAIFFKNGDDFISSCLMVMLQFLNSLSVVLNSAPVPG